MGDWVFWRERQNKSHISSQHIQLPSTSQLEMLPVTPWQAGATIWLVIHILKYPHHLFFLRYMNSAPKEEAELSSFLKKKHYCCGSSMETGRKSGPASEKGGGKCGSCWRCSAPTSALLPNKLFGVLHQNSHWNKLITILLQILGTPSKL